MVQRVLRSAESEGVTPDTSFARTLLDGPSGRQSQAGHGVRTSGMIVTPLAQIQSREKVVWDWPDPADRLIEELA
jgi:hypothetical protein